MEITDRKVLILGGNGLVGYEVAKQMLKEKPKALILLSLRKEEVEEAIAKLEKNYPNSGAELFGEYGNIFISSELKDKDLSEIKACEKFRERFINDVFSELKDDILQRSFLYQVMTRHKPDVVVDSVNTATAISYQNIFETTRSLRDCAAFATNMGKVEVSEESSKEEIWEALQQMQNEVAELKERSHVAISSMYTPQLVRHIQILYHALKNNGAKCYVKIGTSGTGGMGLNIPYTHGEERPSRVLLSKSAVGGAHTLLLFLLARTPGAPVIKEIKPTAAIAWREINYGPISKGKNSIYLYKSAAEKLETTLQLRYTEKDEAWRHFTAEDMDILNSVYIDTGENGLFSKGEFEAITSMQQMEFVTPEEIARSVIFEITGRNTGHDVLDALDSASMGPTYRAGFLRTYAVSFMKELEEKHDCSSVAFEMLGPPRLSKLLFECHLLQLVYGQIINVLNDSAQKISNKLEEFVLNNDKVVSRACSIGIPILLRDGKQLLRGPFIKIPPYRGQEVVKITSEDLEHWAKNGWVDLRQSNCARWRERLQLIEKDLDPFRNETSSAAERGRMFGVEKGDIEIGEIVGWIFNKEEEGARMK